MASPHICEATLTTSLEKTRETYFRTPAFLSRQRQTSHLRATPNYAFCCSHYLNSIWFWPYRIQSNTDLLIFRSSNRTKRIILVLRKNKRYHSPLPNQFYLKKDNFRTSLVVEWTGICLPTQGTWVRSLVREDSTRRWAAKPMNHS